MLDLLLALVIPGSAGTLGWWIATLTQPRLARMAANDNTPVRVRLPACEAILVSLEGWPRTGV